jgi:hypothetical protein
MSGNTLSRSSVLMVLAKPWEGRGPTKGALNWKSLDRLPHLCTPGGGARGKGNKGSFRDLYVVTDRVFSSAGPCAVCSVCFWSSY